MGKIGVTHSLVVFFIVTDAHYLFNVSMEENEKKKYTKFSVLWIMCISDRTKKVTVIFAIPIICFDDIE
jgi:hypothetical protein